MCVGILGNDGTAEVLVGVDKGQRFSPLCPQQDRDEAGTAGRPQQGVAFVPECPSSLFPLLLELLFLSVLSSSSSSRLLASPGDTWTLTWWLLSSSFTADEGSGEEVAPWPWLVDVCGWGIREESEDKWDRGDTGPREE